MRIEDEKKSSITVTSANVIGFRIVYGPLLVPTTIQERTILLYTAYIYAKLTREISY